MAACPECQRPVAITKPRCLYCGAPIDPGSVPPPVSEAAVPSLPLPDRTLIVLGLGDTDVGRAAHALGVAPFEVGQRQRRGGWHLHKVLPSISADAEAARLREAGLTVHMIPEAEVRTAETPTVVRGGDCSEDTLLLRTDNGEERMPGAHLLLLVTGEIRRERPAETKAKKKKDVALEPGLRIHVHAREAPTPFEIDPDGFAFDKVSQGSSSLTLRKWTLVLSRQVPLDDGFRFVPPALGPSPVQEAKITDALRPGAKKRTQAPVLDNLRQFRFYSGWRAAVERRI